MEDKLSPKLKGELSPFRYAQLVDFLIEVSTYLSSEEKEPENTGVPSAPNTNFSLLNPSQLVKHLQ